MKRNLLASAGQRNAGRELSKVNKMLQVNLEEAKGRLLELIHAVLKGETVLIINDLQEAVQLVPAASVVRRQFGSAKGLIVMADNFDAPLPDFNAYMP